MARVRPPHYARDYRRKRAKSDPTYLKREQEIKDRWRSKKVKRCPEWEKIEALCNRLGRLRDKLNLHVRIVGRTERELIATAKRYNDLREKCRGV